METSDFYGTEKVSRILLKIAPPVMLAQLIQALYNIVDSFFVGKYSETGLTALSIIYPVQLLMIALGVGTGVGINTDMAYYLGIGKKKKQKRWRELVHRYGTDPVDYFCSSLLCYAAGICRYVNRFPGSDPGCGGIRQDRMSFQHWSFSRQSDMP